MEAVFPRVETNRLVLRQVTQEDAEDVFVFLSDPDVMKYYGNEPFPREQIGSLIQKYDDNFENKRGIRLGIEEKNTGRIIGTCGLQHWDHRDRSADLVYILRKDYWSQGIMTEALGALIQYGFEQMDLYRVQGKIEAPNIGSHRVVEKIGLKREGVLRGAAYTFGEFRDLVIYGKLRTDE
ncbi:GNAT family N-acetyltransferase [Tumebacillus sp. ITR2]|uniref:GNAT family N-acetyltransferase n=1 Tax=Tumebacillus amylolyticus TaxID=2801339 RepID=A0ABS1JDV7_9BACL|nr:GNAT family N-acetyltransferase [Tumebacillus amylolyticus]MBL0388424.1 GNAT family N-acetyltransferase [Tumebacillus amylolyticus]